MTDLVERLRINSGWRNQQWQCVTDPALLTEAADLIEELEAEIARKDALMEKVAQAAIDASAGPLDDCGVEIETALTTEGIYVWGPDGERFERMFEAVMARRRALSPKAIVEGVK